jgi:adenylate cyclase
MMAHVSPRKLSLSATAVRVLIAAAAVMLTAWTQLLPLSGGSYFANEWLRDGFIRLHASNAPESRIVVIDIDESSLTSVGPWPWPRTRLATLIENLLSVYEARGVALDMVLPERADAEADMRLALLAQHGPVVLAQAFDYTARPAPLRVGQVAGGSLITAPAAMLPMASGYIGNHAGLAQAGRVGNIGVVLDEDGALRRLPMLTLFAGRLYPSLSLQLLNCCCLLYTSDAADDYSLV